MVGSAFNAALRDAQQGRPEGMVALFRAHQPALRRTLCGLAPELADRAVAATWRQVVRDLDSFTGDEYGFRVWVITLGRIQLRARSRTDEHPGATSARSGRELRHLRFVGPPPGRRHRAGPARAAAGQPASEVPAPPPGRGAPVRWTWPITTDEALARVRDLPPDQAEAVLLRVVAGLQPLTVADRLHLGSADARTRYQSGLRSASRPRYDAGEATRHPTAAVAPLVGPGAARIEALLDDPGFEPHGSGETRMAQLVALLRGPTTPADLTGEREALAAFTRHGGGRVLTRARRRTAAIAVVSAATTVMTITTAAAATGTLPPTLQQLAHAYVGAPAPAPVVTPPPAPPSPAATHVRAADVRTVAEPATRTPSDDRARDRTPAGTATSAGTGGDDPVIASPLADPTTATTPEPSAAPSVTDPPDARTAPTTPPTDAPSGSATESPTATTEPSATPSGTPSASAASPTDGTGASPASTAADTGAGAAAEQAAVTAPPASAAASVPAPSPV